MKLRLRWRIMIITVVPLLGLAFMTVWIVNRSISKQVYQTIHEDLRRSGAVLENVLSSRATSLAVAGQMIVQDPKFFSVLTIPGSYRDPQLRETVAGVARDFNAITQADLFEVTDARGEVVAAVGHHLSAPPARAAAVRAALDGRATSGVLEQPGEHFQITVTPVLAGGRLVGTLLLGARIGGDLAESMQRLTRSDVTFISRGEPTSGTLVSADDRHRITAAVADLERRHRAEGEAGTLLEVRGAQHLYVTLVGRLPGSVPEQSQFFVMQRALDAETVFLRETQMELLGLGIAAALIALLAGALIAQRITSPVQRLVRGAEEMERGNYDFPLPRPSQDEIGELSSRFEVMRRQQREYVHSLQEVSRAKSEFISVASHELRTPISIIQGFQELMLNEKLGPLTSKQRMALEATDKSVVTLLRIADDAMHMAQIEGGSLSIQRGDHEVKVLIEQAIENARSLGTGRKVTLEYHVSPELPMAHVDGANLVQALVNLITNGIRFTPDSGRVEVRAFREDSWLVITVRDTGVGIEPEHQSHIFERAFVVKNSLHHHSSNTLELGSAGLGLGLPIARGIAQAHGGQLTVESTPGQGSTFTLRVPLGSPAELKRAA